MKTWQSHFSASSSPSSAWAGKVSSANGLCLLRSCSGPDCSESSGRAWGGLRAAVERPLGAKEEILAMTGPLHWLGALGKPLHLSAQGSCILLNPPRIAGRLKW